MPLKLFELIIKNTAGAGTGPKSPNPAPILPYSRGRGNRATCGDWACGNRALSNPRTAGTGLFHSLQVNLFVLLFSKWLGCEDTSALLVSLEVEALRGAVFQGSQRTSVYVP